jgi:leucine-rich repeat-containing G protein-coupled receptor 8
LRYAVWIIAFLSCIGNISVLWSRLHDENQSVSIVIRSLAFSDLLMGVYLLLIGLTDARFRSVYHENSGAWIKSWECATLGMFAVFSSEVSIFILSFMSIERFLLISNPFGHHKISTKSIVLSLFIIWMLGAAIAILPLILFSSSTKYYGVYNSGVCIPLFIIEAYSTGWLYSAIVFLGINLLLLILIATLYTVLLFSIFRTRRATSLNFFDCEVAIRY